MPLLDVTLWKDQHAKGDGFWNREIGSLPKFFSGQYNAAEIKTLNLSNLEKKITKLACIILIKDYS